MNPIANTVVLNVRGGPDQPIRARNAGVALLALNRQSLERSSYRVIVVEQDAMPHCRAELEPLADQYVFAFNPGPYNRSWACNIGAKIVDSNARLCFLDSDIVVPADFLAECFDRFESGVRALKPYSTVEYLARETSEELAAAMICGICDPESFRGPAWPAVGGAILVDAALYLEMGGHDERFRGWGGEDKDFWLRLTRRATVPVLERRLIHLDHERAPEHDDSANRNRRLRALKQQGEDGWPGNCPIGDIHRYAAELRVTAAPVLPADAALPVS